MGTWLDPDTPLTPEETLAVRGYSAAANAIHAGTSALLAPRQFDPRDLRVGITLSKSDHAALAVLLFRKGLITRLEYFEAIRDLAVREVAALEAELSREHGHEVRLLPG